MKWIFFTLIMLNLLIYGAQQWTEHQKTKADVVYEVYPDARPILLLNEGMVDGVSFLDRFQAPINADRARCVLLGPFGSHSQIVSLVESKGMNIQDVVIAEHKVPKAPGYRVYIDAPADSSVGETYISLLKQKGVDHYLIRSGRLKGAISLGVFDNIDSARNLMIQRKNQGFDVVLTELRKTEKEFWMASSQLQLFDVPVNSLSLPTSLLEVVQKRIISCKSVASYKTLS